MLTFLVWTGLIILTIVFLAIGCAGGGCGFIIAAVLCIPLWIWGLSAHEDAEAEKVRERIAAIKEENRLEKEAREKELREEQARQAEKARREQALRDFARKEMAQALQTYTEIGTAIQEQEQRTARLRQTLEDLDKSVMWNWEYRTQKSKLSDMRELREELWESIETAYLEAVKCETTFGEKAFEARRKAIAEGRKDAELMTQRFDEMRKNK